MNNLLITGATGRIGPEFIRQAVDEQTQEQYNIDSVSVLVRPGSVEKVPALSEAYPSVNWLAMPGVYDFDFQAWQELASRFNNPNSAVINLVARQAQPGEGGINHESISDRKSIADFLVWNQWFVHTLCGQLPEARVINLSSATRYWSYLAENGSVPGQQIIESNQPSAGSSAQRFVESWVKWCRNFTEEWSEAGNSLKLPDIKSKIFALLDTEQYGLPSEPGHEAYGITKLAAESLNHSNQLSLIPPDVIGGIHAVTSGKKVLVNPRIPGSIVSDALDAVVRGALGGNVLTKTPELDFGNRGRVQSVFLSNLAEIALASAFTHNMPAGSYNIASPGAAISAESYAQILNEVGRRLKSPVYVHSRDNLDTAPGVSFSTSLLMKVLAASNITCAIQSPNEFIPEIAENYYRDLETLQQFR